MSMVYGPQPPGITGKMHYGRGTLGILGSAVPTGSIIRASLNLPADAGKRYRGFVASWPSLGTLLLAEDGTGSWAGLPDGSHTFSSALYEDGVQLPGSILVTSVLGALAPAPPPAAGFYPQRRSRVRWAAFDPRAQPDLTAMYPGERLLIEFDFAPYTSVSAPAISVQRLGGSNGTADVVAYGAAAVQGAVVQQFFEPGTPGNTYLLTCTVTAAGGARLSAVGRLPVRNPA